MREIRLSTGEVFLFDYEEAKLNELFLEYKELVLNMCTLWSTTEDFKEIDKYIYDNYEKYRQFIKL